MNTLGVAGYAALAPAEVLARWRAASAANRRRFRGRADSLVDGSIGDYPCRWQAFHVAAELATHADDIGVPVTPGEYRQRTAWRARYSRFALAEAKPQLDIRQAGAATAVTDGSATVELDDDELIEAVMGRLDETSGFSTTLRALVDDAVTPGGRLPTAPVPDRRLRAALPSGRRIRIVLHAAFECDQAGLTRGVVSSDISTVKRAGRYWEAPAFRSDSIHSSPTSSRFVLTDRAVPLAATASAEAAAVVSSGASNTRRKS